MMRKFLAVIILLLFIGISVIPSTGKTVEKRSNHPISNGNTLYVGGTGANNYTKIQDAIDNATSGDTVFVYDDSSPYYENIIFDISINLIGEDRDTTVIDGTGFGDAVYVSADWVNISGFTIQNSSQYYSNPKNGINISSNYNTITGNNISNNGYGISLTGSNNTINGNIIIENGFCIFSHCWGGGIYLDKSKNNTIIGNNISNNLVFGIYINDSSNNNIHDNEIKDNGHFYVALGIGLYFSNNNVIIDNNILKNPDFGAWSGNEGILLDNSNNNTIIDNSVICKEGEYGNGIYLGDSNDNIIIDNAISKNWDGINLGYSSRNNLIYHNNLINNTHNGYDKYSNTWDNGKSGNYWDDYTGTDSNGDGIGDTPYPIPGGDNEDSYPLMDPWGSGNKPPGAPNIDGPPKGKPGIEYEYTFNSTDLHQDPVMYIIEWGDNTTEWTEYSDSGEEIILKHNWSKKGDYTIKAKAKDIYGAESNWSEFEVIIPRIKVTPNSWFHWLFERFPLLEKLLTLFRVI